MQRWEFCLVTQKDTHVSGVRLERWAFVKQHASGKALCPVSLQGAVRSKRTTHGRSEDFFSHDISDSDGITIEISQKLLNALL